MLYESNQCDQSHFLYMRDNIIQENNQLWINAYIRYVFTSWYFLGCEWWCCYLLILYIRLYYILMELSCINSQWFASACFKLENGFYIEIVGLSLHLSLSSAMYFWGVLAFCVPSRTSGLGVTNALGNSGEQWRKAMSSSILVKNTHRAERRIANWKFSVIPTFKVQTITM